MRTQGSKHGWLVQIAHPLDTHHIVDWNAAHLNTIISEALESSDSRPAISHQERVSLSGYEMLSEALVFLNSAVDFASYLALISVCVYPYVWKPNTSLSEQ